MAFYYHRTTPSLVDPRLTLPGRDTPMSLSNVHQVHGRSLRPPFPEQCASVRLGMGCFWGAERVFWSLPGVWTTAVGYAGGQTPHPRYEEVCSGRTNHSEVVLVVYDPRQISLEQLLQIFWEHHDSTQAMRQGNDIGTQYRSVIYTDNAEDETRALASKEAYQQALERAGVGKIQTEIRHEPVFYYAEEAHQQYLAKHPNGYCGLQGTGVPCPRLSTGEAHV